MSRETEKIFFTYSPFTRNGRLWYNMPENTPIRFAEWARSRLLRELALAFSEERGTDVNIAAHMLVVPPVMSDASGSFHKPAEW